MDFIDKQILQKGVSPTHNEIAKRFRLSSVATVHEHLAALEKKGYLQKIRGQARSLSPNKPQNDFVSVPLVGIIAAGEPIEAIENRETIAIPRNKIPMTKSLFALRVSGESMIDEGIHDQDVVLIRKQNTARNGDKVVALINNTDATLKTFYSDKNGVRLQPANKNFAPIIIREPESLMIQGVVVDVIKKYDSEELAIERPAGSFGRKRSHKLPIDEILCGDAIEVMRKIPDESIDMLFADPPFNLNKKYSNYKDRKNADEYIQWCEQWLTEMVRITKPTGSIFVHNIPKWLIYYANHLNKIAFFKHWIAWDSMSNPLGKTLLPAHYGILFYTKIPKGFTFNELRSPHRKCRSCGEMIKDYGGKKKQINPYGTLLSDVWADIHRIRHANRRDLHPCQLPEPLLERLILMTTNENDVVLDPFLGAGTTALAAKRLGRHFIGIDIDPKYKAVVEQKLAQVKYRQSNGYAYGEDSPRKTTKYLRNLTLSENEGIYPLDQ